jgi:hypothetical protein
MRSSPVRLIAATALLVITAIGWISPSLAGSACKDMVVTTTDLDRAGKMAGRLKAIAAREDITAAIVGRMGSDLSQYGLRYSHLGILYREDNKNIWYFRHMLNRCNTGSAGIYQEGLMNFFLDAPIRYEAILLVPSKSRQKRLREIVLSPMFSRLFTPDYNMISNP